MKLSELIRNLQSVYEKHGDLKCIYSTDDEGNEFKDVNYSPSVGVFVDGFYETEEVEKVEVVCIN